MKLWEVAVHIYCFIQENHYIDNVIVMLFL